MKNNYAVYHLHTEDSLLDSCTNYKLYIDKAAELGQTAIAFTEHGNLYNHIEKKMYANSKGLKYIHGVEIYLTESLDEKIRDNYHSILLAKNYDGVKEINLLVDKSTQPDHFYYKPRISFEEFFNISDNVIKISACLASPLSKYPSSVNDIYEKIEEINKDREKRVILIEKERDDKKAEEAWIHLYDNADLDHSVPWAWRCTPHEAYLEDIDLRIKNVNDECDSEISMLEKKIGIAKENYEKLLQKYDYYEIQPHVNSLDQVKYNQMLYEASKQYGKPLIAGTDVHSINSYKAECRSILQKAKRIMFSNEDEFDLTYKSYDELVEMFKRQNSLPIDVILEAINNTNVMADSVEDYELDTSFKYPKLYDNEEEVFKKRINSMYKDKLSKGIIKKNPKYKENVLEEMRVFKKIGMTGFMLFMSELISWCWENGIPVGPCRGSVGGSTIAYLTDIIDVDPIVWNTVFSRFCNEDRVEIGDIDVDISPSQRQLVYDYIINRFGADNTAYVLAIGTISDKGTIDEIGRALNIPLDIVATIKKRYSEYVDNINTARDTLKKLDENPLDDIGYFEEYNKQKDILKENENLLLNLKNVEHKDLFYYFDGLVGTAISQSMHPAGIIVSPVTLPDNYGTFWGKDGKRILNINMEEIHEVSLVKYDILGLKNIEVIKDACALANIPYPKSHEINWEDSDVWDHIADSPVGIFQFESKFAYDSMKKFNCRCVDDLSLVNSAIRPSGESYRDRLLAHETNKNPSKIIDDLLAANRGFLVFQEDTLKFLTNICGLSGSEADNIRRAIGRKQKDRLDAAMPKILEGYCSKSDKERSVAEKEAKEFLQIIEDSARYQFGYNHSTGYSMIGYMCAYLRYHYPKEFITAYLNNANNDDDITNGTELAKLLGIEIRDIKFRHSASDYSCNKNGIYKGISSIKFLNKTSADKLYELRDNKYDSFIDLLYDLKSISINSRQLEILIKLDYFSEFGDINKLLKAVDIFDQLYDKSGIKKDKLAELNLAEELVRKYAMSETETRVEEIDCERYLVDHNIQSDPDCMKYKYIKDEFGNTKEKVPNGYSTKKTIKKYQISQEEQEKYASKIVIGKFSDINMRNLLSELFKTMEFVKCSVKSKLMYQKEHLGYINMKLRVPDTYYYITLIDGKYSNKIVSLYQLKTGNVVQMKVKGKTLEEWPLVESDIINVLESKEENKWGRKDGQFYMKDEKETILKKYNYVR